MLEEDQRRRPPRAINIIRPSSPAFRNPFFVNRDYTPSLVSASTCTTSTCSTALSTADYSNRIAVRPTSPFAGSTTRPSSPSQWSGIMSKHAAPVRPGLLSLLHGNSYLSRPTDSSDESSDEEEEAEEEQKKEEEEEEEPVIVAKAWQGCTVVNGRREDAEQNPAKLSRKIADLEIEITSLTAVNASLEATAKEQAAKIAELERRLARQEDELPPTPVSVSSFSEWPTADVRRQLEEEQERMFEHIKHMLQSLIEQAQRAIAFQYKTTGRVLTPQKKECPASPQQLNRRSWPSVTPKNSRLMRMATESPQQRLRSPSMTRTVSSP